jgi:hypothetical protein
MPGAANRTCLSQTVPADPNTPLPLSLSIFPANIRTDAWTLLAGVDLEVHPNYYNVGDPHGLRMVVHYEDLRTVALNEEFADEVVDGMGVIIANTFPHIMSLDCASYEWASGGQTGPLLNANDPWVTEGGYRAYQQPVLDVDMHGLRYLFVPINQGGYHWVIAAYDIQNGRLLGYDPLYNSMVDELNNVERILRDSNLLAGPVTHVQHLDMPQQEDGTSCGPGIVAYMLAMARDMPLPPLSIHVVEILREFCACSILSNSIGDSAGSTVVESTQHSTENVTQRAFAKAIQDELPMDFLILTRAEAAARAPGPSDRLYSKDATGTWVTGFMPGQAIPFDYVMMKHMDEQDCLTFTDGTVHVGQSYFQWGASLLSEPTKPQPNATDMYNLELCLAALSNRSEEQQDLLTILRGVEFTLLWDRVQRFGELQSLLRNDQQQARLMRQIFKYMFYLTMFYRRWRGPGHRIPLAAANTKQPINSPSQLSRNIPVELRQVNQGRAYGINQALVGVIHKLAPKCHRRVRQILKDLPFLDIGMDFEGLPVPYPVRRTTVPNTGPIVVMTRLWQVFEMIAAGNACVRETSHLVARSVNFYFALITGQPLVPYENLESMGAVV